MSDGSKHVGLTLSQDRIKTLEAEGHSYAGVLRDLVANLQESRENDVSASHEPDVCPVCGRTADAAIAGSVVDVRALKDESLSICEERGGGEREVLSGNAEDVEDLSQYQSKVRTRLKGRLDRLEEDIELLDNHEPEIAADLHERVCGEEDTRLAKLEREVAELRKRIDD